MKKLIGILLCVLILSGLTLTVLAADAAQMTIEASEMTVRPGDTVSFSVKLTGVERSRSAAIQLDYDQSAFEFLNGACSLNGTVIASFRDGTGVFTYGDDKAISGEIFVFRLKVKSDAAPGEYSVSATGNVRDANGAIPTTVNKLVIRVGDDTVPTETTNPVEETTAPTEAPTAPTEETKPAENVKPTENVTPTEATKPASEDTMPTEGTEPVVGDTTAPVEQTEPAVGATVSTQIKGPVADDVPPRNSFPWWTLIAGVIIVAGGAVTVIAIKKNNG